MVQRVEVETMDEFIEYNTSKSAQHPTPEGENVR